METQNSYDSPYWRGYMFGNPDNAAHPDLGNIVFPEESDATWGNLVTPDEIRYIFFVGNAPLVTQNGSYITDEMIQGWIDQTVEVLSARLKHEIYPKQWRHRAVRPDETRRIEPGANWEDSYDYENRGIDDNWMVVLRRRPIVRLEKWEFREPYTDGRLLDLLPGADIKYRTGILRNTGWAYQRSGYRLNMGALRTGHFLHTRQRVPNSHYIDYVSGYDHAERVPVELREVIQKLLVINIASAYGDGLSGSLANFSISVGGALHESVGTAMSSTSAMFGARQLQLTNELKEWFTQNEKRYQMPGVAVL